MSAQRGHKRKRSLQDTPVDLTKMQLARQRLAALQEELSGIKETETEMEEIMNHVDALQSILGNTKKLVSRIVKGVSVSCPTYLPENFVFFRTTIRSLQHWTAAKASSVQRRCTGGPHRSCGYRFQTHRGSLLADHSNPPFD